MLSNCCSSHTSCYQYTSIHILLNTRTKVMPSLTTSILMVSMSLLVITSSGKRISLVNREKILVLSAYYDAKHWTIYIDELLYHRKHLQTMADRIWCSLSAVSDAMHWCQLPDQTSGPSPSTRHISQWSPCGSLVMDFVFLPHTIKQHDIVMQVAHGFHITLKFQEFNIKSRVHQPRLFRSRQHWFNSEGRYSCASDAAVVITFHLVQYKIFFYC